MTHIDFSVTGIIFIRSRYNHKSRSHIFQWYFFFAIRGVAYKPPREGGLRRFYSIDLLKILGIYWQRVNSVAGRSWRSTALFIDCMENVLTLDGSFQRTDSLPGSVHLILKQIVSAILQSCLHEFETLAQNRDELNA